MLIVNEIYGSMWFSDDASPVSKRVAHEVDSVNSRHHTREMRAQEGRDASICHGELLKKHWLCFAGCVESSGKDLHANSSNIKESKWIGTLGILCLSYKQIRKLF